MPTRVCWMPATCCARVARGSAVDVDEAPSVARDMALSTACTAVCKAESAVFTSVATLLRLLWICLLLEMAVSVWRISAIGRGVVGRLLDVDARS